MSWDNVGPNACQMDGTPITRAARQQAATAQSTAAAERSAHVTRGPAHTHDAASIVVETSPGIWQLRRVWELETALRAVIEAADAGCPPAVIARPARRALASMETSR